MKSPKILLRHLLKIKHKIYINNWTIYGYRVQTLPKFW